MTLGKIGIQGLKVSCIIGDLLHERENEQNITIDVEIHTHTKKWDSDDLQYTVDYVYLAQLIEQIAQEGKFFLLEALVYRLSHTILDKFNVKQVWIRANKPQAISQATTTFVEMSLTKESSS